MYSLYKASRIIVPVFRNKICHWSLMQTEKPQPEGKHIMPETRFTEFPAYPLTPQLESKWIISEMRFTQFPALSDDLRVGISQSALKTDV